MLGARQPQPGVVEQRLLRRLLRDYDTDARGVSNPQDTVTVTITLLLLRIQALVRQHGRILLVWRIRTYTSAYPILKRKKTTTSTRTLEIKKILQSADGLKM